MATLLLQVWVFAALAMSGLWLWQRRHADAGIVDVGWAAGIGLAALWSAWTASGLAERRWLVAVVAVVWSGRLAIYLFRDRVRSPDEDGRYRALRERWGPRAQRNMFIFFQVQALFVVLFLIPIAAAMANPRPLCGFDVGALVIVGIAICGEALADRQLSRFRRDPAHRGRTCRDGLWRYSRHPNYFFEWLHWWGYLMFSAHGPAWGWAALGPLVMLAFLFKLTGIPYTEQQALRSRGDDYRAYQRTTSVFFPWFPGGPSR